MNLKLLNTIESDIHFTRQEIKVLKLASEGITNKEIGDMLCIAESTVKCHRKNIMQKAGIKGKSEMMKFLLKINMESTTKVL